MNTIQITYLIYIVVWEIMVWGGTFYACVYKGYSGWLWVLAILMSGAAYTPEKWNQLLK